MATLTELKAQLLSIHSTLEAKNSRDEYDNEYDSLVMLSMQLSKQIEARKLEETKVLFHRTRQSNWDSIVFSLSSFYAANVPVTETYGEYLFQVKVNLIGLSEKPYEYGTNDGNTSIKGYYCHDPGKGWWKIPTDAIVSIERV